MQLVEKRFPELTNTELYEILKVRVNVFVVEQNCPYPELDDRDRDAVHVWLRDENGIQAYLRVMDRDAGRPYVSIGRVLAVRRRQGLGSRILAEGMRVAKERFGAEKICVEAQTYARGLYEKQGFRCVSEEFLEDGIPHIRMIADVSSPKKGGNTP